jgi:FeS assembly SUF system regulator
MLRISKLADYGCLAMGHMARDPAGLHSASELALTLGLGVPTVSKVLKALARAELVTGVRGLHGGYVLARAPEHITVADIVDALEGHRFGLTECSAGAGLCSIESSCHIRDGWQVIGQTIRRALEDVSLATLAQPSPSRRVAGAALQEVVISRPLQRGARGSAQGKAATRRA